MAVRFQLDNGETKEYQTYWANYSSESTDPPKYHTKCGLCFEKQPEGGACGHLDCAMHVARDNTLGPIGACIFFLCVWLIGSWYFTGDPFYQIQIERGLFAIFGILMLLMSISSLKSWRELREFKNHGTIHGVKAYRI